MDSGDVKVFRISGIRRVYFIDFLFSFSYGLRIIWLVCFSYIGICVEMVMGYV